MNLRNLAILFLITLIACGPAEDHLTDYQKTQTYPVSGQCKEPVAAVVIERNGRFDVTASTGSASLEIKERGIFSTADHVVFLDVEYRLFFCGKVYKARRRLDPGVSDIGFLEIVDKFDPSDFPEPYGLAESVTVGEQVFIRGIHIHPPDLQAGKMMHGIVRSYYGLERVDEFVYDDLSAIIVNTETSVSNSDFKDPQENLKNVVFNFFSAKAIHDHIRPFGGLSGGPTVNRKGQKVGINSNGPSIEGHYSEQADGSLRYHPVVTMNLLPVDEIKRAVERIK